MKLGIDVYNAAISLLGYVGATGQDNTSALKKRALIVINAIYSDMYHSVYGNDPFTPLETLDSEFDLPQVIIDDCIVYGVAALLAQDDPERYNTYMSMYNMKRSNANHSTEIVDTFPSPQ